MRRAVKDKVSLDRLVDGLIDAYVDWRAACDEVGDAYRSWTLEMGSGNGVAFGRYMAALDGEEYAAEVYATLVRGAYKRLWGEKAPAEAFDGRVGGMGRP